jgi:hypothetical protein
MGTRNATRKPSKAQQDRKTRNEERRAEVEVMTQAINDEAPDYLAFLNRWGDRYGQNNLNRLWVQYPRATVLHKFPTWQKMGRQVRTGESAIWLKTPRTSRDPEKITPENPDGEVFHGASWVPLFDYAQTDPIGDFAEDASSNPDLAAEVKRLRMEAVSKHPDVGGSHEEFVAAWARYEAAKARLDSKS